MNGWFLVAAIAILFRAELAALLRTLTDRLKKK